jgi:hypothetical protein
MTLVNKIVERPGMEVHTCNPSYSEGKCRRLQVSKIVSQKNKIKTKKGWGA